MLIDLNIEADFIYLRFFKDIIIRKLKLTSIMEVLFGKLQKPLECYNIFFNITNNL